MTSNHVAVGGPNLPPPGDGLIADAVALSPGGPIHVLLTDREAEHVPGCNMAFKKSALEAIGGFDPRFRTAGDDVDVCWRLTARDWTIGFHPAALVWHHRRNSIRTYWKQQAGYGRAEALLAGKWPEKHNGAGHASWSGRLYGPGRVARLLQRGRIYQGSWGTALFQSLYERTPGPLTSFLSMPEWWFVVPMLAVLGLLGFKWTPLRTAWPLFGLALGAPLFRAIDRRGAASALAHRLRVAARSRSAARGHRPSARAPADRASRWSGEAWPHVVASAGCSRPRDAARADGGVVERALARADRAPRRPRVVAPRAGANGGARRRLGPMGPRTPARMPRGGPAPGRDGRAWTRPAAHAIPRVGAMVADRGRVGLGHRRVGGRRHRRPCLVRREPVRGRRGRARLARPHGLRRRRATPRRGDPRARDRQ
ncbi:MAG: hypothetical protein DME05_07830 [Candidatus Rokuibacteriota bacterium]|nr:MAG: hypothetical protein DME05_07830 [Candidatus Rokubacteria bacterium]